MGSDNVRLSIEGASKAFGQHILWSEVSFQVEGGEILALRGQSGSGKSTLLNCIGKLIKLDKGTIQVNESDLTSLSGRGVRKYRQNIVGYLFQDYALVEEATVKQNLDIAARPRLFQKKPDYEAALEKVGLSGRSNSKVYELSGGEQQRVAMARLLLRPIKLLLADEPTAALDGANEKLVLELIKELADQGCAVIIATHHDSVAEFCTKEAVVENKQLISIR